MKQIFAAVLIIILVVSLIVGAFTINQVSQEELRLKGDLQTRSTLAVRSFKEAVEPNFIVSSPSYLQTVVERYSDKERIEGLSIYNNKGKIIASSSSLPKKITASKVVTNSMDSDTPSTEFIQYSGKKLYLMGSPLHENHKVVGSVMLVQNASYIDDRIKEIWRTNMLRLAIQALLISLATLLVIRWIIYEPVLTIVQSLRDTRIGRKSGVTKRLGNLFFFKPLIKEVAKIEESLLEARFSASEEAKLRLEKLDSPWTAQRLKELIKDLFKDRPIFVVSNREPYVHTKQGKNIDYFFPASGMATAIEAVMQACSGMWIAHGSGDADKLVVDAEDKIQVPPDEPKYTLKRVWLTKEEERGYYYGFANEGLWPLCHLAHNRPIFRKGDWTEYKKVNGKFAEVILKEIKGVEKPVIFIQDFHFSLLPRMIKNARPDATIAIFWHIPWPSSESFSICPWKKEILDGMLGADLIGFHTQLHCNNFIDTISRELESLIDFERFTITREGHNSLIKPFPISIAFANGLLKKTDEKKLTKAELLDRLNIKTKHIGIGVDRLDYTKGILERFKAIEIFLDKYPQYQGNFSFIQIAAPSRSEIKKYHEFSEETQQEVDRINTRFKTRSWKPIVFLYKHHSHSQINALFKIADFCLITSLHDGMNLVAKEFVAAREDELGALILSQFTGASKELKDALIVNPYSGDQTAEAIHNALAMNQSEQKKRMKSMREIVKMNNVYRWSAELLKTIDELG